MAESQTSGSSLKGSTSTYNSADSRNIDNDTVSRIRMLQYPLSGGNNHYINFKINVTEESRLIREGRIATEGYVDNTEQSRANRNQSSTEALTDGINAIATVGAVSVGAGATAAGLQALFRAKSAGAAIATAGAVGAGAAGYAAASATGIGNTVIDTLKLTQRLKRLTASISLYTPANIRANYNFNYDTPDDLIVHLAQMDNYDAIKKGINAMGSALTNVVTGDTDRMDSIGDIGSMVGAAGKTVGRILGATNSTISMLSRTVTNKRRDIMFQYVGNRTFNFEYVFAPRSQAEAKEVDDIIFMFKYFAHPEMLKGYGNFLYLYPAEFDIEYGIVEDTNVKPEDRTFTQNKFVNKISSCVLEAVDVNYAPESSFQTLENGEPLVTTLSLQFREIESLHRDRIAKGY